MFFCRVMKYCLDLSVQLTYQDCFNALVKDLGPTLYLSTVILSSDLVVFLKNNSVHGMHQVKPIFFDYTLI